MVGRPLILVFTILEPSILYSLRRIKKSSLQVKVVCLVVPRFIRWFLERISTLNNTFPNNQKAYHQHGLLRIYVHLYVFTHTGILYTHVHPYILDFAFSQPWLRGLTCCRSCFALVPPLIVKTVKGSGPGTPCTVTLWVCKHFLSSVLNICQEDHMADHSSLITYF